MSETPSPITLEIDSDKIAWLTFDLADAKVNLLNSEVMALLDRRVSELESRIATGHPVAIVIASGKPGTSGVITVHDEDGRPIIAMHAHHTLAGDVMRRPREGQDDQFVFEVKKVTRAGGLIEVFDGDRSHGLVLAHQPQEFGLYATQAKPLKMALLAGARKRASRRATGWVARPKERRAWGLPVRSDPIHRVLFDRINAVTTSTCSLHSERATRPLCGRPG